MTSVTRFFVYSLVFLLFLILIRTWYFDLYRIDEIFQNNPTVVRVVKSKVGLVESKVTLFLRHTPDTSKYIMETVQSFLKEFPQLSIFILCDIPLMQRTLDNLSYYHSQIDVVNLKPDLFNSTDVGCNIPHVKTEYVLIAPIGIEANSTKTILYFIKKLKESNASALAIPVSNNKVQCLDINLLVMQWTVEYKLSYGNLCDAVKGDQAILTYSKTIRSLSLPLLLPFPEAFYLLSSAKNMKVKVLENGHMKYLDFYKVPPNHLWNTMVQRQLMFEQMKLKKVVRENGIIEWYGCSRKTQRCFGDLIDSVPGFLVEGRWTPPCCLKVLRETAIHVLKVLKKYNIRFWLEGGSLLGAMRKKDIIPWDYDIDIGIYREDIKKCPYLQEIAEKDESPEGILPSIVDDEGFVWEKSRLKEGNFFRVQASAANRLHVDLFPFTPENGIMVKDSWFSTHTQDKEFPEHYLKPLTTIEFAGVHFPAPNNIRDFLEFKFGRGCIENPVYPDVLGQKFPPGLKKYAILNESRNYEV